MRRVTIPASPQDPNPRKRFRQAVTVILGDDIESDYDANAKDLPDDLPQFWTDPEDNVSKPIEWLSNFGLTRRSDNTPVTRLPEGKKYTIELPRGLGKKFVFYDGANVQELPTRPGQGNTLEADLTLADPPVGVIK